MNTQVFTPPLPHRCKSKQDQFICFLYLQAGNCFRSGHVNATGSINIGGRVRDPGFCFGITGRIYIIEHTYPYTYAGYISVVSI